MPGGQDGRGQCPGPVVLPQLMQCITLNQRYAQIAGGVISPTDIGYFLAFTAVFLAATVVVLARRKQKRR